MASPVASSSYGATPRPIPIRRSRRRRRGGRGVAVRRRSILRTARVCRRAVAQPVDDESALAAQSAPVVVGHQIGGGGPEAASTPSAVRWSGSTRAGRRLRATQGPLLGAASRKVLLRGACMALGSLLTVMFNKRYAERRALVTLRRPWTAATSSTRGRGRAASSAPWPRKIARPIHTLGDFAHGDPRGTGPAARQRQRRQHRHGEPALHQRQRGRSRPPRGGGRRGSKPPSARQRCARVISSQAMPASPVAHASPASSASGTA